MEVLRERLLWCGEGPGKDSSGDHVHHGSFWFKERWLLKYLRMQLMILEQCLKTWQLSE